MSVDSVGGSPKGATAIAASGLRAATRRLEVAAHNIANLNTDGFVPSRVLDTTVPEGGVQSAVQAGSRNQGRESADAFAEDTQGGSQPPAEGTFPPAAQPAPEPVPSKTNPVAEIVSVLMAEAAFMANLRVLKTDTELSKRLLESLG
jgi:flagellar basal-body rod protein FlgC